VSCDKCKCKRKRSNSKQTPPGNCKRGSSNKVQKKGQVVRNSRHIKRDELARSVRAPNFKETTFFHCASATLA
jgi:hypothetical protein